MSRDGVRRVTTASGRTETCERMSDRRGSHESILRAALWCGVGALTLLGVASALGRAASVAGGGLTLEQIQRLFPAQIVQEAFEFDRWFAAHPVHTFAHVIIGGLFLALTPLQFSSRIRERYVRLHRRCGRALLLAALLVGLSGLTLGALFPYGGRAAASAVFTAGTLFLFALVRAFKAIRRGDVARHREWMIRMFSIGLGIATVRVVGLLLLVVTRSSFRESAGTAFWVGWLSTFAAAELWIRYTRPRRVAVRVVAARAATTRTHTS
jgi:uncharacterized membrane protein